MTDGHTGGDGVRVHDEVGRDPLAGERHVLLVVGDPARALLPVPAGKLVPDLGDADRAHANLAELVAILVDRQHHLHNNNNNNISLLETLITSPAQQQQQQQQQHKSTGDTHNNYIILLEHHWSIIGNSNLVHDSTLTGSDEGAGISLLVPLSSAGELMHIHKLKHYTAALHEYIQSLTSSSFSGSVMVLPMMTSEPLTLTPGATIPSSSSLS